MTGFATAAIDATFLARIQSPPVRPALFVYIDWPGETIRAHNFVRTVTALGESWTGVGGAGLVEISGSDRDGRAQRCTVGLRGLALQAADVDEEEAAVGAAAEVYLGAFDQAFASAALHRRFVGHVEKAMLVKTRSLPGGRGVVVDLTVELSDGQNPRNRVIAHHAVGAEAPGDRAAELMHTVTKDPLWPAS